MWSCVSFTRGERALGLRLVGNRTLHQSAFGKVDIEESVAKRRVMPRSKPPLMIFYAIATLSRCGERALGLRLVEMTGGGKKTFAVRAGVVLCGKRP